VQIIRHYDICPDLPQAVWHLLCDHIANGCRSDSPRDAQAVRQHVIASSTWPAALSVHSGSDADDDTSSMGGWSDAASGYSDASNLRIGSDPSKGRRHAMWQDRGLALIAALSNILPSDHAAADNIQTSQGHHGAFLGPHIRGCLSARAGIW
jgi:hypothetical protein